MEINSLLQDLIKQITSEINLLNSRDLDLGGLLTARVKVVNEDSVVIRFQGKNILAKTLIPLEVGQDITIQFQGTEQGKAVFKLVNNPPHKETELAVKVLASMILPDTEVNTETVKQMLQMQIPIEKKDVLQLVSQIRNMDIPTQDIKEAVYLFKQKLPLSPENITYLKDFTQDDLHIYKGLDEIRNLIDSTKILAPALKNNIDSLLDKMSSFTLSVQENAGEVSDILTRSYYWQPNNINEKAEPNLAQNNNTPLQNSNFPLQNNNNPSLLMPFIILNEDKTNNQVQIETQAPQLSEATIKQPNSNDSKIIVTHTQEPSRTDKPEPNQLSQPNPKIINQSRPIPNNAEGQLTARDIVQNKLELLAANTIKEPEKLKLFLHNIKEILTTKSEEIKDLAYNIIRDLDSSNPQQHNIKEIIKEVINKTNFVQNLISSDPTNDNQQIIYYSQTVIRDKNENQTPVNIIIKRPKEDKGKKINFDNCTLTVSLNTINLGPVKATVKKASRTLFCQLYVQDQTTKEILTPALSHLTENLEKLNYMVSIRPIKVESKKPTPINMGNEKLQNLFNVDIRI